MFAADFEMLFVAFLLTFQLAIQVFFVILSSKLIVDSFAEKNGQLDFGFTNTRRNLSANVCNAN